MTDKKIIDAELQNIQSYFEAKANMSIGNGKMKLLSWANAVRDALELLKEQEPVMWTYDGYNSFKCSNCDFHINDEVYYITDKPISFCPGCGRKVKWDDVRNNAD